MIYDYNSDFNGIVGTSENRINDLRLIATIVLIFILCLTIVGMDWVTRVRALISVFRSTYYP
jgi:hypothetical protein